MSNDIELTQGVLRELIHYSPDTGVFTWLERDRRWFQYDGACDYWNAQYSGKIAGWVNEKGYRIIRVLGPSYRAHRLAFLYMTGSFPPNQVDHIYGVRDDNRWKHIRLAVNTENQQNTSLRKNNTSGTVGVYRCGGKEKWQAQIGVNEKIIHLGSFVRLEDAAAARKAAEVKYGFHPNHGRAAQ